MVLIVMLIFATEKIVMGTPEQDLCFKNCVTQCQGGQNAIACTLSCTQACYNDAAALSGFDLDCLSQKCTNFKYGTSLSLVHLAAFSFFPLPVVFLFYCLMSINFLGF